MRVTQPVAARTDRVALGWPSTVLVALGLALVATPVAAGQTADKAMTVFVTASEPARRARPTEADRQQASAAIEAAQFATVPRTYRFLQVTRLAAPTDDEPWWRFEGTGLLLWSAPAKLLSGCSRTSSPRTTTA